MYDEDDARQEQQDNQDSYMESLENQEPVANFDNIPGEGCEEDDWDYDY